MHVLVIGGTQFIGPYVVRQLARLGNTVTVYHRGQHEAALPESVRHVRSPLAAIPVVAFASGIFSDPIDVVIHMIAMGEADACAAYGRFTRLETGPADNRLLTEDSALRETLYPYRAKSKSPEDLSYFYEKILVERVLMSDPQLPATILRLPKVYGPESNSDLATVHAYRNHPDWRWTHGYVENVAAAIVLAATHPAAAGRIYNVGEEYTPTVAERLATLPDSAVLIDAQSSFDFAQNIAYDTSRIREELGYVEPVSYEAGLQRTIGLSNADGGGNT